jgi:flagellar biosynthesis GTPase FlhF
MNTTKTYRGRSLEELLPRVRAELGPDAVIVRQREGLTGGVGGFFQKRMVEIDAVAPETASRRVDVRDDSPATPDFLDHLTSAQQRAEAGEEIFSSHFEPLELPEVVDDDAWVDWAAESLPPAAAPEVRPVIAEAIPEVPRPEEPLRPAPLPAVSRHAAPAAPDEIEPLREALVAHGLEPRMADALVHETVTNVLPFAGAGPRVRALLTATIANHIPVRPIPAAPGRVIAFVGPGGAGKTHCVGHLAGAYASGSGLPVSCVALRPRDAGSELALLLAPAGVPMQVADDPNVAATQASSLRSRSLVLVDTPSVSPRAKADVRALAAALKAVGADEVVITVPATSSAAAARELLAAGRRLGAGAVALTHADETDHVGPAIGVAMESGLPFAYVGRRPNGRPAVRPAVGEELARALLTSAGGSSRR